jgi:FKBP-type peptidyl-prolyl cis-trans isomerase FkpA
MSKIIFILYLFFTANLCLVSCSQKPKRLSLHEKNQAKEQMVKANKGLVDIDQQRIEEFAKRHNLQMKVTETGMWYYIQTNESNEKATTGKIAHLKYQVSLLDGTVCYSSDSVGDMNFKIGQGGVESGLEEAVLMLKVGEKGIFIMPPHLAYGLLGDEKKIPPRSIIVYNAELINLTDY